MTTVTRSTRPAESTRPGDGPTRPNTSTRRADLEEARLIDMLEDLADAIEEADYIARFTLTPGHYARRVG